LNLGVLRERRYAFEWMLIFTSIMALVCVIWESPVIRWIGGFHLFVVFVTAGLLWETYRGRLRDK